MALLFVIGIASVIFNCIIGDENIFTFFSDYYIFKQVF